MIKKIHIYDLDGTVISSSHRYRTMPGEMRIDLKHWRENDVPEQIVRDSLLPHAAQYKADLQDSETLVIIATARACIYGDANWKFVEEKLGLPDFFIHRLGPNDTRKGADLKISGLLPIIAQFPKAAIHFWEDNADYLRDVSQAIGAIPHFVPSTQGY
jgi:hypothetical protein